MVEPKIKGFSHLYIPHIQLLADHSHGITSGVPRGVLRVLQHPHPDSEASTITALEQPAGQIGSYTNCNLLVIVLGLYQSS